MAIGVYFHPASMDKAKYEDINKRLEAAGAASPKGRLYHHCFGEGDQLMVFDVFDSQANVDAFGAQLKTVFQSINFDPGTPAVMPMVNTIVGS